MPGAIVSQSSLEVVKTCECWALRDVTLGQSERGEGEKGVEIREYIRLKRQKQVSVLQINSSLSFGQVGVRVEKWAGGL